jgi:hypothetical protein
VGRVVAAPGKVMNLRWNASQCETHYELGQILHACCLLRYINMTVAVIFITSWFYELVTQARCRSSELSPHAEMIIINRCIVLLYNISKES